MTNGHRSKKRNRAELRRLDTYIRTDQMLYLGRKKILRKKMTVEKFVQDAIDLKMAMEKRRV